MPVIKKECFFDVIFCFCFNNAVTMAVNVVLVAQRPRTWDGDVPSIGQPLEHSIEHSMELSIEFSMELSIKVFDRMSLGIFDGRFD